MASPRPSGPPRSNGFTVALAACALALSLAACDSASPIDPGNGDDPGLRPSANFSTIQLPAGYEIEKVAGELSYLTSITFDGQGRAYVAESGGGSSRARSPRASSASTRAAPPRW